MLCEAHATCAISEGMIGQRCKRASFVQVPLDHWISQEDTDARVIRFITEAPVIGISFTGDLISWYVL